MAARAKQAREAAKGEPDPQHSRATLVVAPIHAVKPVWKQMIEEFTVGLRHGVVETVDDLRALDVKAIRSADLVVVACELLFNRSQKDAEEYQKLLLDKSGALLPLPPLLAGRSAHAQHDETLISDSQFSSMSGRQVRHAQHRRRAGPPHRQLGAELVAGAGAVGVSSAPSHPAA